MTKYSDDQISDMILDLPDFASGKLSPARMSEIEEALKVNTELQEEFEEVKSFHSAIQSSYSNVNYEGFEANETRLANVITTAQASDGAKPKTAGAAGSFFDFLYGGNIWKPAFAAACGFAAFQTFGGFGQEPSNTFQALSGPETSMPAKPAFLAQFSENISIGEIETLLVSRDLQIVSGPKGGFFYIATVDVDADIATLIESISEFKAIETILPIGDNE